MGIISNGYIKSANIKVFPCAYRGYKTSTGTEICINPEARLNTEYNLTHTGNNLVNSYLISATTSENTTDIECVIGGYYFKITGLESDDINTLAGKYLCIKTKPEDIVTGEGTRILDSWENTNDNFLDNNSGYFTGLKIQDDTTNASPSLKIYNKDVSTEPATITINNSAYLPNIKTGTDRDDVIISGNITIPGAKALQTDMAGSIINLIKLSSSNLEISQSGQTTEIKDKLIVDDSLTITKNIEQTGNNANILNGSTTINNSLTQTGLVDLGTAATDVTSGTARSAVKIGKSGQTTEVLGKLKVNENVSITGMNAGLTVSTGNITAALGTIQGHELRSDTNIVCSNKSPGTHTLTLGGGIVGDSGAIELYSTSGTKAFIVANSGDITADSNLTLKSIAGAMHTLTLGSSGFSDSGAINLYGLNSTGTGNEIKFKVDSSGNITSKNNISAITYSLDPGIKFDIISLSGMGDQTRINLNYADALKIKEGDTVKDPDEHEAKVISVSATTLSSYIIVDKAQSIWSSTLTGWSSYGGIFTVDKYGSVTANEFKLTNLDGYSDISIGPQLYLYKHLVKVIGYTSTKQTQVKLMCYVEIINKNKDLITTFAGLAPYVSVTSYSNIGSRASGWAYFGEQTTTKSDIFYCSAHSLTPYGFAFRVFDMNAEVSVSEAVNVENLKISDTLTRLWY